MKYGELLDLINCLSIHEGGAEPKRQKRMTFDEALALR